MRSALVEHLTLALLILADAEGHQLVQRQRPVAIGRHEFGRRRPEPQPLTDRLRGHPEAGADLLGTIAPLVREPLEGLELIGRVHGLAGDVLVQTDLVSVIFRIDRHLDRMGPLDRLALDQQPQGLAPPLPDGDEVGAGRGAVLAALDLDHGRLQHPLDLDGGGQRLDPGLGVLHLPGVLRRRLQPVQRNHDLRAVSRLLIRCGRGGVSRRTGLGGLSSHVCLLWAWVAGTRTARLKPCPSARPG